MVGSLFPVTPVYRLREPVVWKEFHPGEVVRRTLPCTRHQCQCVPARGQAAYDLPPDSRTMIIAVVTAQDDFTNQIVLKYMREIDSNRERILGVITKPDHLDERPNLAKTYYRYLRPLQQMASSARDV